MSPTPEALTGRFQPPSEAKVAGAAHTVPLATHYQGHTQSRVQLSLGNPHNPHTAVGVGGGLKAHSVHSHWLVIMETLKKWNQEPGSTCKKADLRKDPLELIK